MTQHRFYGLRGKAYGLLKEKILKEESQELLRFFDDRISASNKFTPKDLGECAMHFCIPLTVLDDLLNKATNGRYPAGTWDRLKDKGCKARDIGVIWE